MEENWQLSFRNNKISCYISYYYFKQNLLSKTNSIKKCTYIRNQNDILILFHIDTAVTQGSQKLNYPFPAYPGRFTHPEKKTKSGNVFISLLYATPLHSFYLGLSGRGRKR